MMRQFLIYQPGASRVRHGRLGLCKSTGQDIDELAGCGLGEGLSGTDVPMMHQVGADHPGGKML